ncbi:dihydrodipicolinate reductase [Yoonia sp. 208BN28-4]|uniref:dihydrodipicolinate reductase n=1 Tax=Yoonia sp. 208BN28-4 TaxID=3126505 RepID=UPI0030A20448
MKSAILAFGLAAMTALAAVPAAAQSYQPVTDKATFLQLIGSKNLTNRLYGVDLRVGADGTITGSGAGWDITGTWSWQNGYFCREMNWGGDPIPYNCQLVESAGNDMRFTTDQGAGDSAAFTLR